MNSNGFIVGILCVSFLNITALDFGKAEPYGKPMSRKLAQEEAVIVAEAPHASLKFITLPESPLEIVAGITEININSITKTNTPNKTMFNVSPLNDTTVVNLTGWGLGITLCSNSSMNDCTGKYVSATAPNTLQKDVDVEFDYDMSPLTEPARIMFAVTAESDMEKKGAGYVFYQAEDIKAVLRKIGKDEDQKVALRMEFERDSGGVEFETDNAFCNCETSPCYLVGLEMNYGFQHLCMTMIDLGTPSRNFSLCDETLNEETNFGGIEDPYISAKLIYTSDADAELILNTNYVTPSNPDEISIVYYRDGETSCETHAVCQMTNTTCTASLTGIPQEAGLYQILVVSQAQSEIGSNLYGFEDYKVKLQKISDTAAEIRWTIMETETSEFTINLDGSDWASVNCSSNDCLGYISPLDATEHTILISMSHATPGTNIVGFKGIPQDGEGIVTLDILKLLRTKEDIDNKESTIEITTSGDATEIIDITLALLCIGSPTTEYVYQNTSIENITSNIALVFQVNSEALDPGQLIVLVVAHGEGNIIKASGEKTFTIKAITTKMNFVGAAAPGDDPSNSLRVYTDTNITVSETSCSEGITYILGENAPEEPVEVCDSTIPELLACDQTRLVNPFDGLSVTSIEVTLEVSHGSFDIKIDATYDTSTEKIELVFYKNNAEVINDECKFEGPPEESCQTSLSGEIPTSEFQLLMVEVQQDESVKKSLAVNFENYGTTLMQLTTDLMEVSWFAATKAIYNITLDKEVDGAYNSVTVDCGGAGSSDCQAYFMMLISDEYIASVKQDANGDMNIVAGRIVMSNTVVEALKISGLMLIDEDISLQATICLESSATMVASRESNYKVTLINATGHFHSAQNTPDANNCIVGPKIDSAFNTAAEVRILVTSGNESNRLVGDAQLFLHDPNAPASINHLLAKQVGKTILRMKWRNLNDATKYEIIHEFAQNMTIVECDSGEDCTGHIHVPAASIEAVTVTLIENGDIQQITTTSVNIQNSIADIEISRINPLWDDRVLVCFETPLGVDSYELGLEVSNEILEITVNPEFTESEEGTSCFVSRNTVEVGAYVELWSLISAYDVAGNLMASGEKTLQSVFLSVNRAVYGAVINDSLLTSWHLIDSTKGISHITVVLKALTNQGVEVMDTVDLNPEETSYRFGATEGKYTICVKAVAVSVSSKEICSDIIHVRTGQEVMVPPVASASPKTTSKNGVLVVWESSQDEDVTGFLISWTQILSSSTSTPIPSSQRENEGYLYPLDLVRTVSRDRNAGETGFKIVSASETYVEIVGLATGGRYTLCVASVKEDVVGSQNCDISDLSQYQPLEAPANLHYEGGLISWQGYESSNYLVQWQSRADKSEGGSDQVVGISYRMSFMPGQWDVKIRTMTDISFSDAAGTTLFIEGLVVSARQSQESSITASWYEETIVQTSTTSKIDNRSYEVKILQNEVVVGGPDHVPCVGWLTRCSHEIINLNMSATSSATVIVTENGGGRSASYNLRVEDFTDITLISKTIRSSSDVEVSWNEIPEAENYHLTLYTNNTLSVIRDQAIIPTNRIKLTLPNLIENVLAVQACSDKNHCGNMVKITLERDDGAGPNKTTIIIASTVSAIVGVAMIAVFLAIVLKKKSKKPKHRGNGTSGRAKEDPTSDDTWGNHPLAPTRREQVSPEQMSNARSSRQSYDIPSTFNMHS